MELRMNQPSYDEYEEVESPFSSNKTKRPASRDRLRTRKNVFNRPFATDPTTPPTYVEATATRRSIGHGDNTDLIEHRQSELGETEIEYLDDEEVEIEEESAPVPARRPSRAVSAKKKTKLKQNLLSKIGWSVIGLLVLRLVFMDRGVWDYFSTERTIHVKNEELASLNRENNELKTEISRIQVDKNYQRQLAKEHLGVIAADEFLILFAGETGESSGLDDRQL